MRYYGSADIRPVFQPSEIVIVIFRCGVHRIELQGRFDDQKVSGGNQFKDSLDEFV